ncbi:hypothetical protein TNCV_3569811 [Trichonephila clavipes]|nr:hypothetical protein TNCV_3569811 [Trichonephila clavipes]
MNNYTSSKSVISKPRFGRPSKLTLREKRLWSTALDDFVSEVPRLRQQLSTMWFCDVLGVAALIGRGGHDFRSEDPIGVVEPTAIGSGFDWRMEVSFWE